MLASNNQPVVRDRVYERYVTSYVYFFLRAMESKQGAAVREGSAN